MFGLIKMKTLDVCFDNSNPVCAPIFHRLFNKIRGDERSNHSQKCFQDVKLVESLRVAFNRARDLTFNSEMDRICDYLISLSVGNILSEGTKNPGIRDDLFGGALAMSHIREFVFAYAPALTPKDADATFFATLTILLKASNRLRDEQPGSILFGAGRHISMFGMNMDSINWDTMSTIDQEKRFQLWNRGYDCN